MSLFVCNLIGFPYHRSMLTLLRPCHLTRRWVERSLVKSCYSFFQCSYLSDILGFGTKVDQQLAYFILKKKQITIYPSVSKLNDIHKYHCLPLVKELYGLPHTALSNQANQKTRSRFIIPNYIFQTRSKSCLRTFACNYRCMLFWRFRPGLASANGGE